MTEIKQKAFTLKATRFQTSLQGKPHLLKGAPVSLRLTTKKFIKQMKELRVISQIIQIFLIEVTPPTVQANE